MRFELATVDAEFISSLLWDRQTTGIATVDPDPSTSGQRTELLAGFESADQARQVASFLRDLSPERLTDGLALTPTVEPIKPESWVNDELVEVEVGATTLSLEVGTAFGHGAHPTTSLLLDLMADLADSPPTAPDSGGASGYGSVLDFGCGTGVLALAALALGASTVVAVDNDPAALAVATANLSRNQGVIDPGRVEVIDALPSDGRGFDLTLANVLLPVHQQWGPRLQRLANPGSTLLISGVLSEQRSEVIDVYDAFTLVADRRHGDWTALTMRHRGARQSR